MRPLRWAAANRRRVAEGGVAAVGLAVAAGVAVFARSARQAASRRRQLLEDAAARAARPVDSTGPANPTPAATGPAHPDSHNRPAAGTSPLSASGRLARNVELARMSTRIGRNAVSSNARQVFASAGRRQQLRAERQLRSTAEVVETLGSMKGAFMKLGQMASYLDPGLPDEVRRSLAALQTAAPPMAPELAASVVAEELGGPPEAVFAEWDPVPIAAASIGQVHRAITADGRPAAVKVQYPGVNEAIRADLDNSEMLLGLLRRLFPALDAGPLVAELRSRIGEELDYRVEGANQQAFAERFTDHPFIHVPQVIPELSTGRVLTSELVGGARYDEVLSWSQEERNMACEAIFRFVFGCLYRMRAFNGDPHPGNYLFHGGGRVTFLDFGLVKWFDQDDVKLLEAMIKSMVLDGDVVGFRRAVEEAGFLRPDPTLSDEQVAGYFSHYYELVLRPGPLTCTPQYASETLRHFFEMGDPVVKRANVPPAFAILQRINLGLYAVLAGLGATADWRRVAEEIWPFVAASPSTPLGQAEAGWAAAHPEHSGAARRPEASPGPGPRAAPGGPRAASAS